MKIDKNKQVYFIFIFLCVLFLGGVQYFFLSSQKESLENKTNLQIVIARYNEDLEWLKEHPFNQYPVILYNKGPNDNFYHAPNILEHIKLPNIGRDAHTILYHIIEKYDNLADVTVFLPGSAQMPNKFERSKMYVNSCAKYNNSVILYSKFSEYFPNSVNNDLYHFQLDNYVSTDPKNKNLNPEDKLLPAEIRPFGKWHQTRFPNVNDVYYISFNCILGLSKKHIHQKPKSYYQNLIKELSTHSSPEVVHYYERAWFSVFHPLYDSVVIEY